MPEPSNLHLEPRGRENDIILALHYDVMCIKISWHLSNHIASSSRRRYY